MNKKKKQAKHGLDRKPVVVVAVSGVASKFSRPLQIKMDDYYGGRPKGGGLTAHARNNIQEHLQ